MAEKDVKYNILKYFQAQQYFRHNITKISVKIDNKNKPAV